jgi:hypothetical protein
VFLCLGGLAGGIRQPLMNGKTSFFRNMNKGIVRYAYPVIICAVSIVIVYMAVKELQGNRYYNKAVMMMDLETDVAMEDIFEPLDVAINASPNHPDYLILKLQLLYQAFNQTKDARFMNDANQILALLADKEPFNRPALEISYSYNVSAGKIKEALLIAERSLKQTIWGLNVSQGGPNWYERAVALNYELGSRALTNNQTEENIKYWNQAMFWYEMVKSKKESLKFLPKGQLQGEPFDVTPQMSLWIDQIKQKQRLSSS